MTNALNWKALGTAFGVVCGLYMFIVAIFAMWGWGDQIVAVMSDAYIGYSATLLGALLGFVYAFIDGFIIGALLAVIYNKVANV